jgi:ribosomal protein S24E
VRKEEREPVSKLEKYPTYDLIYELLKRKEVRVKVIYQGENHTISNTLMGNWVLESPHELGFKKEIVIIFRGGLG